YQVCCVLPSLSMRKVSVELEGAYSTYPMSWGVELTDMMVPPRDGRRLRYRPSRDGCALPSPVSSVLVGGQGSGLASTHLLAPRSWPLSRGGQCPARRSARRTSGVTDTAHPFPPCSGGRSFSPGQANCRAVDLA